MTRRLRLLALWAVFLTAHALTAWLGWVLPGQPMGDVTLVYEPWARSALTGGAIVGVTEPWVYPQLALVPMMLAQLLAWLIAPVTGAAAYLLAWAVLVTLLDVVAFALLLGRRPNPARRIAAWFWCAALTALGPVALYRIDAITVPLAVVGGLWLVRRPAVAAALLAVGAWVKVWPGAMLLAASVAAKSRTRLILFGGGVAGGILLVLVLIGGQPLGFLTAQTGRGLQIEAVVATPFLWLAIIGDAAIEYSFEILTFQIAAPTAEFIAALTVPALVLVVGALAATGAMATLRGASFRMLFPPLTLALVLALIVFNKVGSPQFLTWLFAPVIVWLILDRRRAAVPAILTLVLCGLTFLVYPVLYADLLDGGILAVTVVSIRNALLVVLSALSVARLVRVLRHPRARS